MSRQMLHKCNLIDFLSTNLLVSKPKIRMGRDEPMLAIQMRNICTALQQGSVRFYNGFDRENR